MCSVKLKIPHISLKRKRGLFDKSVMEGLFELMIAASITTKKKKKKKKKMQLIDKVFVSLCITFYGFVTLRAIFIRHCHGVTTVFKPVTLNNSFANDETHRGRNHYRFFFKVSKVAPILQQNVATYHLILKSHKKADNFVI